MSEAIGYLRVSTREQGRSGWGLAAQRREIEAFSVREGISVTSWQQDVQTGAGTDALQQRPGLAAALNEAKSARCPLIVSKLDRLSFQIPAAIVTRAPTGFLLGAEDGRGRE
jgi:DNA invertase Pin-like site-specific DNA recombinase